MNYVVGFIFDKKLERVLLIKKNKGPIGMAGKLNGIGGKIEKDEAGNDAIICECREETGMNITDWIFYCKLIVNNTENIYFYYAIIEDFVIWQQHPGIEACLVSKTIYSQLEDEELGDYWINSDFEHSDYKLLPHVANLEYLIPMALNHYKKLDSAKSFEIIEKY